MLNSIHTFSSQFIPIFQEKLSFALSDVQKRTAIIALAAIALFTACYIAIRYYRREKAVLEKKIEENDKKIKENDKLIEELTKKHEELTKKIESLKDKKEQEIKVDSPVEHKKEDIDKKIEQLNKKEEELEKKIEALRRADPVEEIKRKIESFKQASPIAEKKEEIKVDTSKDKKELEAKVDAPVAEKEPEAKIGSLGESIMAKTKVDPLTEEEKRALSPVAITFAMSDPTKAPSSKGTRSKYNLYKIENDEKSYIRSIWIASHIIDEIAKNADISISRDSWALYLFKDKVSILIGLYKHEPTFGDVANTIGRWISMRVGRITLSALAADELTEGEVTDFEQVLNIPLPSTYAGSLKVGLQYNENDMVVEAVKN